MAETDHQENKTKTFRGHDVPSTVALSMESNIISYASFGVIIEPSYR